MRISNYQRIEDNLAIVRGRYVFLSPLYTRTELTRLSRLQRPLTLPEKIVYGHLDDPHGQDIVRLSRDQLSEASP
jgi:aconitate hydratase